MLPEISTIWEMITNPKTVDINGLVDFCQHFRSLSG